MKVGKLKHKIRKRISSYYNKSTIIIWYHHGCFERNTTFKSVQRLLLTRLHILNEISDLFFEGKNLNLFPLTNSQFLCMFNHITLSGSGCSSTATSFDDLRDILLSLSWIVKKQFLSSKCNLETSRLQNIKSNFLNTSMSLSDAVIFCPSLDHSQNVVREDRYSHILYWNMLFFPHKAQNVGSFVIAGRW